MIISRIDIDKVRSAVDIADVIRDYVPSLSTSGRSLKGLCPFHGEKTPSFHVQVEKGFYKCFGCNEAGDVITFISKIESLTFVEATQKLAQRAGITIKVDEARLTHRDDDQIQKLHSVLDQAQKFYSEQFWHEKNGRSAREYLFSRGITEETARTFQVGFAPMSGTTVIDSLLQNRYPIELCALAGLAVRSKSGRFYDPLFGRLIFPIRDNFGHVIAFGGRIMPQEKSGLHAFTEAQDGESEGPKYINSPESPVFSKGRTLYGLPESKTQILKSRRALVCEGYMDVIGLYQGGYREAVATLGTAFTSDHAKILKRYVDNVYFSFDPDAAGQKATLKGIEPLVQAGLFPRIVHYEGNQDPDEIILEQGLPAFLSFVEKAKGFVEHWIGARNVSRVSPVDEKAKVAQELAVIIAQAPSEILKAEWLRETAVQLGLSLEALNKSVQQKREGNKPVANVVRKTEPRRFPSIEAEYLYFLGTIGADALSEYITEDDFSDERERRLFKLFVDRLEKTGQINLPALHDDLQEIDREWFMGLFLEEKSYSDVSETKEQMVRSFRIKKQKKRLAEISQSIAMGAAAPEVFDEYKRLLKQIKGTAT